MSHEIADEIDDLNAEFVMRGMIFSVVLVLRLDYVFLTVDIEVLIDCTF